MTDFFALLGQPRRPWLDPDALKDKYHELTALHHPDASGALAGTGDFAEINTAYQTLFDAAARLRHLLDLESPVALSHTQPVPPDVAAFFTPVAAASQSADAFLKKHGAASSPLAKALLSTEQHEIQDRLEDVIEDLQIRQNAVLALVREADALWLADQSAALERLPTLWQSLGYLGKWLGTLRELLFRVGSL